MPDLRWTVAEEHKEPHTQSGYPGREVRRIYWMMQFRTLRRHYPGRALLTPYAPLGAVVEDSFGWGDDRHPNIPWEETIIYETHVKGISKLHPEVPEELRGSYRGLSSEPVIDHLKRLGITTVELLPVQAFVNDRHLVERGLSNYWGYNPLGYFAPQPSYAAAGPVNATREFKRMVRLLHAEGLEVIIDVVYNHTGEGNRLRQVTLVEVGCWGD